MGARERAIRSLSAAMPSGGKVRSPGDGGTLGSGLASGGPPGRDLALAALGDRLLTAIAPLVWGTTYLVTTKWLPAGRPLTIARCRALPAGLLILVFVRTLPSRDWWWRAAILGGLNIALFWAMLFLAAFRLPGGVAATIIACQPLIVSAALRFGSGDALGPFALRATALGVGGVALLVLTPAARLDLVGLVAGLAAATSWAAGTILTHRWRAPVSPLTLTAWQLTAGGIWLLPAILAFERTGIKLGWPGFGALAYLCLVGAAATYALWFRGLTRLSPDSVSALALLSPVSASLLGWALNGERLTLMQLLGLALTLLGLWISQRCR